MASTNSVARRSKKTNGKRVTAEWGSQPPENEAVELGGAPNGAVVNMVSVPLFDGALASSF